MHTDDPIDAALAALEDADREAVPSAAVTHAVMAAFDQRAGAEASAMAGERWRWAVAAVLFMAAAWGIADARREQAAARAVGSTRGASRPAGSSLVATKERGSSPVERVATAEFPPVAVALAPDGDDRAPLRRPDAGAPTGAATPAARLDSPRGTRRPQAPADRSPRTRADESLAAGLAAQFTGRAAEEAFVELAPTSIQDLETVRLVRVRLPEAALRHLSIAPAGPPREGFVQADVLLGDDGFARAIRVVP